MEHGNEITTNTLRSWLTNHFHSSHLSRFRLLEANNNATVQLPVTNQVSFDYAPITATLPGFGKGSFIVIRSQKM